MERLRSIGTTFARPVQRLCDPEVLTRAEQAAGALCSSHCLRVDIWHVSDWHDLVRGGVAVEQLWRESRRARIQSRYESALQLTRVRSSR